MTGGDGGRAAAEPPGLPEPLGLYVHWPFCLKKCPYCDFNSHVAEEAVPHALWRASLLAELRAARAETADHRLVSIFFGGGTPSLMAPETAAAIIGEARQLWPSGEDLEITLEANPTSVEADRLADFRQAGIGRLSLGVQALDDGALHFLGREHSAHEAMQALELARASFPRVSIDLIYALPGMTADDWRRVLGRALDLGLGHLSLYQLTIEPGTVFHGRHRRGELAMPDEETGEVLFDLTQELAEAAGLPAYEVSNHARPGEESRHNLVYWRGEDYVGIGPGAHGRVVRDGARYAIRRHRAPAIWLDRVRERGDGTQEATRLSPDETAEELLMMGLRLREGVDGRRFWRLVGTTLSEWLAEERLAALAEADLIRFEDHRLSVTAEGRKRLNAVLGYLVV